MKNKIIFLSGPTATGKTSTSLNIANLEEHLFEIVNFDSLLFYKELSIGTAKPTKDEMQTIPHHMIDICSIEKPMDAARFVKIATPIIDSIMIRGKIPILTGGSGFYLRALVKGMIEATPIPQKIKDSSEKLLSEHGIVPFRQYLKENDFASFELLHENDHYRIVRAYEHHLATGKKISKDKEAMDKNEPYDFSKNIHSDWDILNIYLDVPKSDHYQIIKNRAIQMIQDGLIEEVNDLLSKGFSPNLKPLQSIGYKETLAFINEEIPSQEELIEKIFISTRQLAKSQRTFFKKIVPKVEFNSLSAKPQITQCVQSFIQK